MLSEYNQQLITCWFDKMYYYTLFHADYRVDVNMDETMSVTV